MKVVKKQRNARSCIICGMDNPASVKGMFYEMENGELRGLFRFGDQHQSYPGRVHGGVISAMLDELIGRAIWIPEPDSNGVTMTLTIKYRRVVPINTNLRGVGRITQNSARGFSGVGEIYDMDGNLLAWAEGTYRKLSVAMIGDFEAHEEMRYLIEDDVVEIE
ncbi:MAG: PaaI family thioesterase [Bacteroidales bacterium]|nr:PaaI family thioesterase [Bacteroidales bacterium]